MRIFLLLPWLLACTISAACILASDESQESESNSSRGETRTLPQPVEDQLISLAISLPTSGLTSGEPNVRARMTLTNTSGSPILACSPDTIDINRYSEDGVMLVGKGELHIDSLLNEQRDLFFLEPGESVSQTKWVDISSVSDQVGDEQVILIADYYCPFSGTRSIVEREVEVANGAQFSAPLEVSVRQ